MQRAESTPLAEYRRKRNFARTAEPAGRRQQAAAGRRYVMHHHLASHDHFDLRLERDGVLRSWALPKGPSLAPGEKRLAVEVEDHPLEYGTFEGTIPKGQYGGGTVMLWDEGTWEVAGKDSDGHLDVRLRGTKLTGKWTLVRTRPKEGQPARNWLLIRRGPGAADRGPDWDRSVATGRTMAEITAGNGAHPRAAPSQPLKPIKPAQIEGSVRAPMPSRVFPQLATLVSTVPSGDGWVHEIKLDGYRLVVRIDRGRATLWSRSALDWTHRFPAQARALEALPVRRAILDGEIVALTKGGLSNFGALQEALSIGQTDHLVLQLFDLVYLDGVDLMGARLVDRKGALERLLASAGLNQSAPVRYAGHLDGDGAAFLEQACAAGLEGIISKRADSPYLTRRTRTWVKVKCRASDEFVVGGFTPASGARAGFGALLLGRAAKGGLQYAGKVGAGFSVRQLRELHATLGHLVTETSPFAGPVPEARRATWVQPRLVVEVEYAEQTREGRLRHPRFHGVREDRNPEELAAAAPDRRQPSAASRTTARSKGGTIKGTRVEGVAITNPERIVDPDTGLTKLGLAEYYAEIQDWILPYMANRLLSLVRCPEGQAGECFYQKHLAPRQAPQVPRMDFAERRGTTSYLYVGSIGHLVALVQAGVMEFHIFGSQVGQVERPDLMVLDLDPGPGVAWPAVVKAARALRERLDAMGLRAFVRTTGGKGLHVVVPLKPAAEWDAVKAFAHAVARQHAADDPSRFTTTLTKARRKGRIFIDYLRNGRGATAIASYSTRARPGLPVAVPVRWEELGPRLRPDRYTVANLPRRLGTLRTDPWDGFFTDRVALTRSLQRAAGLP